MAISMEELEEGRRIAAHVVQQCGDEYWPIFDLLDAELSKRLEQENRLIQCLNSQAPARRAQRRKPRRLPYRKDVQS